MTALILTVVAFSILFMFWSFLNWSLDLIEKAQAEIRASEPRNDGAEHAKGKVI
jgi:hypothetical protein